MKTTSYGVETGHLPRCVCTCKPQDKISFPRIATRPPRRRTSLSQRLSTIDPAGELDDKLVAELLALFPEAVGLCLWYSGELQILVPNLTAEEASELELPESDRIQLSVSRWSPKTPHLRCSNPPEVFKDDWQASKMSTRRDAAQCPPQASNKNFEAPTNIAECCLPTREIETPKGELCIIVSDLRPPDSPSSKTLKRKLIDSTEETMSMEPGTLKLDQTLPQHDECHSSTLHPPHNLDTSAEAARNHPEQAAQLGLDSHGTKRKFRPVTFDSGLSHDVTQVVSDAGISVSGLPSTSEFVQHGDAGPSLPRSSTLMNGSATPKSIITPHATRPSSSPQLTLTPVAQATPPAATPPPADPDLPAPQVAPAPPLPPPRRMNNDSRVHIGARSHCATAGVKVRRKNGNGEQYLTVSTHAAYNGANENSLPVCVAKKPKMFRKPKPVQGILGAHVRDAGNFGLVSRGAIVEFVTRLTELQIGTIHSTLDGPRLAAVANPVFPNDFTNNISLVGPLTQPPIRLREDISLSWSTRRRFDKVPVQILGDGAQGQSFTLGTFYSKPFPVHCASRKTVDLSNIVISRSVMFLRNDRPLQNDHMWSGAPVVIAGEDGTLSQVVGFHAFQFGPPGGDAEDFNRDTLILQRLIEASRVTICGAIMPTNDFKSAWEIVPGNE
jgi:hypothetical protein